MGLPGSGKTTLAKLLVPMFNAVWLNADKVREEANDWDFTTEGRMRQAQRMRNLADEVVASGGIAVADFICPTEKARQEFAPDFAVWMDTIEESRYEDTNKIFEKPSFRVDYHVSAWFNDTPTQLAQVLKRFREKNV